MIHDELVVVFQNFQMIQSPCYKFSLTFSLIVRVSTQYVAPDHPNPNDSHIGNV
jgi:hypothetical protein